MLKEFTCCISGSRPQNLPWMFNENDLRCTALKDKMGQHLIQIIEKGYTHFIGGMALGVDQYSFEILLNLRKTYKKITLEASIPYETQGIKWTENQRNRYFDIIKQVDREVLISNKYTPTCMLDRNRYMVDNSSILLAVVSKKSRGTIATIKYAESKNLEIIKITV